jgi:glycosyltransferase involved in cell wall biosynthesis
LIYQAMQFKIKINKLPVRIRSSMKILHVFDFFSPHGGGTVDVLSQLMPAMVQKGHEVTLFSGDFKLDKAYISAHPQVNFRVFHTMTRFAGFHIMPAMAAGVKNSLRDFDIVHLHCARSFQNIVIHRYAKRYGVPYIVDSRGSLPRAPGGEGKGIKSALKWFFDIFFGYRLLRDAAYVIAENEFGAKEYREFGVETGRIAVVPLAFYADDFAQLPAAGQFRRKYNLGEKKIVLSLGRIHRIKGLDFLVNVFAELARRRQDVVLCIAGNDDGYRKTLEKLIARLGLTDRVLFTGFLGGRDKLAAMADADVMVQPSRYENAARVPVEAMLCGTPAIVTLGTGAAEDVGKMGAGYAVEYGNSGQMAQMIESILDNPAEAKEKALRVRQYVYANRLVERLAEDYIKLYRKCVKTGGSNI